MITFTLVVGGCLLMAGVVAVLVAAARAPQGYENEQGFFEGVRPQLEHVLAPGETRFACAADGASRNFATGLGAYGDLDLGSPGGLDAAEPAQSTYRGTSHAQRG